MYACTYKVLYVQAVLFERKHVNAIMIFYFQNAGIFQIISNMLKGSC